MGESVAVLARNGSAHFPRQAEIAGRHQEFGVSARQAGVPAPRGWGMLCLARGGPMIEIVDSSPDVRVDPAEYRRLLGYPRDHAMSERAQELADATRQWYRQHGRPWFYARKWIFSTWKAVGSARMASDSPATNWLS